jgi:ADP-ribose pyrophosphatase
VRDFVGHPGAVAIVALDADGRVALVRQWRLAADDVMIEIPAGGLDLADDGSKEDPELAARRELEEETGLRARAWRKLGAFYSAPGFTDELMHLYLATDLAPADPDGRLGPDEDERLILEWRPWRDAVAAVERGEIRDAKSVAGLFWLARVLDGEATDAGAGSGTGRAGDPDAAASDSKSGDPGDAKAGEVARATYRMTLRETILASAQGTGRSKLIRAMGIGVVLLASFGALTVGDPFSLIMVFVGLTMVTGWFSLPFVWYQARRRPDLVSAEWQLIADENGMRVSSEQVNGSHLWSAFRVVHETRQFFFLDTNSGLNVIIPKRVFSPTDLATFYRLLESHGLLKGRP